MTPPIPINAGTLSFVIEVARTVFRALSGIVDARPEEHGTGGRRAWAHHRFGGGTVRACAGPAPVLLDAAADVTLVTGHGPAYLYAPNAIAGRRRPRPVVALVFDALALGFFGMLGTSFALDHGHVPIIAVLLGVITGVFGGVMRDIIINEVPVVFTPGGFYASAVFAGGCCSPAAWSSGYRIRSR